ncbi:MAG: hypothetical protein LBP75_09945 [Planctomycetota bacterium]|jgi:isopentenyldiphosphate isomerase|nr:hypothetical protein [Planctomycetota bacterium]
MNESIENGGATITLKRLHEKIREAKKCLRILGILAPDIKWDSFKDIFAQKLQGDFTIEIIGESECLVNGQSLLAGDRRISGENKIYELESIWENSLSSLKKLRRYLFDKDCWTEPTNDAKKIDKFKDIGDYKQKFFLRTCYLPIPIPVINIDEEYFITFSLTKFVKDDNDKFEKIERNHPWHNEFNKYFRAYLTFPTTDDKKHILAIEKFSTEMTNLGNKLEVIESYNERRLPMGLLPRSSFLDLDKYHTKQVVWALMFTRDGKLILHKRSDNASDNRNMWDKSVGGHVSPADVDSAKAIAREIAEEMYHDEGKNGQSSYDKVDFFKPDLEKMIFLGEWLPNRRYNIPFDDISNDVNENYYFRLNYDFSKHSINSPRELPNGKGTKDVYTFTDVFVCIVSKELEADVIDGRLKNSAYQTLDLDKIKEMYFDNKNQFTPDMRYIIQSELWKDLNSFSLYVREYSTRKNG